TTQAIEMYMKHLVQGRWGPWIDVSPSNPDMDANRVSLDTRFLYESEKGADGKTITRKRAWYPGGMLCVHTSNRHLELVKVVVDTAATCEWEDIYAPLNPDGTRPKVTTGLIAKRGHDVSP